MQQLKWVSKLLVFATLTLSSLAALADPRWRGGTIVGFT
jgi:hypothetical protein